MGNRAAVIRVYLGDTPDVLEHAETAMFAKFGYVPIARHEVEQSKPGGLSATGVLFLGWLAPSERVRFRMRAVCFAVPG
jgi:hypothetical protein